MKRRAKEITCHAQLNANVFVIRQTDHGPVSSVNKTCREH